MSMIASTYLALVVILSQFSPVPAFLLSHHNRFDRRVLLRTTAAEDCGDEALFLSIIDQSERYIFEAGMEAEKVDDVLSQGAGVPRTCLDPGELAPLLMKALQNNDISDENSGLKVMWDFSGDLTKYVFKNNMTEFIESCQETAREFPTSFYGAAMNGKSWTVETEINRVGGDQGWIATQVVKTVSSDGRTRRWQWELRKQKRPPCLGCWYVESIASSDRKGNFQTEGRGTGWED
mmetsp:Transcript_6072/g.8988  ORF Transcript_6072/g.8988 Transcript_6072/m.8988 type:complete len:235 (+) Transcript_6072:100-804(+)